MYVSYKLVTEDNRGNNEYEPKMVAINNTAKYARLVLSLRVNNTIVYSVLKWITN